MSVASSGAYLHSSSSIDSSFDYLQFLPEWLKKNPFFTEIFSNAAVLANELQPSIDILAKLRDPAIPDTQMVYENNSMLGFEVPPTSLISNEPYTVMRSLGNFYVSRDASYVFLDYLSYIKSTQLTALPLWANSLSMSIKDLVIYTPPAPELERNPLLYAKSNVQYDTLDIFYGLVTSYLGTGQTAGQTNSSGIDMTNYFPTTYFDVQYISNDFIVDEAVILQFILKLKPAHLVFRQFDAIWNAQINYGLPNPVSQIFSYVGSLAGNSVGV